MKTEYFKGSNDTADCSFDDGLGLSVLGDQVIWLGFWFNSPVEVTRRHFPNEQAEAGEAITNVRSII